jgi:phage/plasmid-like protein (TIGR03299 family)
MSRETSTWLHDNSLIGDTEKMGNAWWMRKGFDSQGRPNHFPGAVPLQEVLDRCFPLAHEVVPRRVAVELPATIENMTHTDDDGNPMRWATMDDRRAMHRNGTDIVHGLFSPDYQPHQFREWLINNVSLLMDTPGSELHIHSAGTLQNHAVAYVQFMPNEAITGQCGMTILPWFLATTSFNGKVASTYKFCQTAVVCDNTLDMARGEKDTPTVKYRHTKNSLSKISDARTALGITWDAATDTMAELDRLAETPVKTDKWIELLDVIHPVDLSASPRSITTATTMRDRLTAMYHNDPRVNPWNGTALGVFQAFNTYNQHVKPTRGGTDRGERNMLDTISGKIGDSDREILATMAGVGILTPA